MFFFQIFLISCIVSIRNSQIYKNRAREFLSYFGEFNERLQTISTCAIEYGIVWAAINLKTKKEDELKLHISFSFHSRKLNEPLEINYGI